MELLIDLVTGQHLGGDGVPRRKGGGLTKDREFLDHKADVPVRGDQFLDRREGAFAETAAIVEEFDHRDIAIRVAAHKAVAIVEDGVMVCCKNLFFLFDGLFRAALLEHLDRLHQDFGVFHEIVADFAAENRPLVVGHLVDVERECRGGHGRGHRERGQGGTQHIGLQKIKQGEDDRFLGRNLGLHQEL